MAAEFQSAKRLDCVRPPSTDPSPAPPE